MSNRRSARNRHKPQPLPPLPQTKKHLVDPRDFAELVGLGSQMIPKFHAQAMWNSAEMSRAGIPAGIVGILAGAGAVGRQVAQVIAKHVPEPTPGQDLRATFPEWACDILTVLGVLEPVAPPAVAEAAPEAEVAPEPVKDDLDLAVRAEAAGLVIAS